jgi:hypothetical protein
MPARRFSKPIVTVATAAKILGVRSGDEHRYTAVWVVVHGGRVFVRSWNDKPAGWYRAFVDEPLGSMQLADRHVRIRARKVRGERLLDDIDAAYREKYPTPASRKWVRGFARPKRRATTLELLPR